MRSESDVRRAIDIIENRLAGQQHAILALIDQQKRDVLRAYVSDTQELNAMEAAIKATLHMDLSFKDYLRVQATLNAIAFIRDDLDSI